MHTHGPPRRYSNAHQAFIDKVSHGSNAPFECFCVGLKEKDRPIGQTLEISRPPLHNPNAVVKPSERAHHFPNRALAVVSGTRVDWDFTMPPFSHQEDRVSVVLLAQCSALFQLLINQQDFDIYDFGMQRSELGCDARRKAETLTPSEFVSFEIPQREKGSEYEIHFLCHKYSKAFKS